MTTLSPLQRINIDICNNVFFKSGILEELRSVYDCNALTLLYNNTENKTVLHMKPTNMPFEINSTITTDENNIDTIRFNLAPRDGIIDFYSIYKYDPKDPTIRHEYKYMSQTDRIPSIISTKGSTDNLKSTPVRNIYIEFNKYSRLFEINEMTPIEEIIDYINNPDYSEYVKKVDEDIKEILQDRKRKIDHDSFLRHIAKTNMKLKGLKRPEPITTVSVQLYSKEDYRTNNWYTNLLAARYARYYSDPDIDITLSSFILQKKVDEDRTKKERYITGRIRDYIDFLNPSNLKQRLQVPFMITDLFFLKSRDGAQGFTRYELQNPETLIRTFKLMELAKSIMFTFLSIRTFIFDNIDNIMKMQPGDAKGLDFYFYSIYKTLSWANNIEIDKLGSINMSVSNVNGKPSISFNREDNFDILEPIPCVEIPFIDFDIPIGERPIKIKTGFDMTVDYGLYSKKQIYVEKLMPTDFDIKNPQSRAFEKDIMNRTLDRDKIDKAIKSFFSKRNKFETKDIVKEKEEPEDTFEINVEDEAFPALSSVVKPKGTTQPIISISLPQKEIVEEIEIVVEKADDIIPENQPTSEQDKTYTLDEIILINENIKEYLDDNYFAEVLDTIKGYLKSLITHAFSYNEKKKQKLLKILSQKHDTLEEEILKKTGEETGRIVASLRTVYYKGKTDIPDEFILSKFKQNIKLGKTYYDLLFRINNRYNTINLYQSRIDEKLKSNDLTDINTIVDRLRELLHNHLEYKKEYLEKSRRVHKRYRLNYILNYTLNKSSLLARLKKIKQEMDRIGDYLNQIIETKRIPNISLTTDIIPQDDIFYGIFVALHERPQFKKGPFRKVIKNALTIYPTDMDQAAKSIILSINNDKDIMKEFGEMIKANPKYQKKLIQLIDEKYRQTSTTDINERLIIEAASLISLMVLFYKDYELYQVKKSDINGLKLKYLPIKISLAESKQMKEYAKQWIITKLTNRAARGIKTT